MIHLYTGDGKGKTTAAIGLGVRAAGAGLTVGVVFFMKPDSGSEALALERLPGVEIRAHRIGAVDASGEFTFLKDMGGDTLSAYRQMNREMLAEARALDVDLLILDEICSAALAGMVPVEEVLELIEAKRETAELVLTGRDPMPQFLEVADYVSVIRKHKHPYDKGILARKGIEF
ncbi:MAG: cob(I)yrinic acid a,c-diamide adenosyltransferase [Clostridiales bacterium]|nr:cob(I)yrinic acid a,c-diamide adenosyltransferase [Clostridiales bacterium]